MNDPQIARAAQVLFPLLYEHAPEIKITEADQNGPFAKPIKLLLGHHQTCMQLSAKTGKIYDAWSDCQSIWEGLRADDDGTKQYGLLDQEIRRIAVMLDNGKAIPLVPAPPKATNGTEYTTIPTMPQDVNDLLDMERKATIWYAPSFLREGLGLLVGQPNVGKTPAAIQLTIALARGDKWFGTIQCRQSKVLYLGMEYSPQELIPMFDISRMGKSIPREWLLVKTIEDDFPTSPEAALAELEWYLRAMEVKVIVIDVLTAFLPPEKFKQNVYRGDYSELKPYHRLALKYNAAILGVWHASKRESDPRIMYNGSTGMWAAAASRITMYQDQEQRVRISSFPRMGDRLDWALTQEKTNQGRRWIVADAAPEPMMSPAETQIYRCLKDQSDKVKPFSPTTIADLTGILPNTVKGTIRRMFEKNLIQQIGHGYYVENDVIDVTPVTDVTRVPDVSESGYKVLPRDDEAESHRVTELQEFQSGGFVTDDQATVTHSDPLTNDAPDFFDPVPPSKRTFLRLYLRGTVDKDQDRARELCKEFDIDYEQARKEANQ